MISLKEVYGDKIFDRKKAYAGARKASLIIGLALDVIISIAIIKIFDIQWNYAFIKILGLLCIYGILKQIFSYFINLFHFKFFVKNIIASEIKHYLKIFGPKANWDEIGTYDDLFLESAFNKALPADLNILAAINYGIVVDTIATVPSYEDRCYKLFSNIAPEYVPPNYVSYE